MIDITDEKLEEQVQTICQMKTYRIDKDVTEEYVRTEIRTSEAERGSQEWATQVESVVDEVVEEVDPNTPQHRSLLSAWIRRLAKDETDE